MLLGILLILLGLFLNQWMLEPFMHLPNGQVSILRITLIGIIDILCIAAGAILILKNKPLSRSPKKAIFAGILLLLMVLFTECMLQVIVRISPQLDDMLSPPTRKSQFSHKIPDPLLGHRPNPNFPGHDENGFRNKAVLSQAGIVAIGDSQTYGTGVKRYQAWPQQLGKRSGYSIYNLAYGGYGSVHGLILMENKALQLNPKYIVFMMYDGNDLVDAYKAIYGLNLYEAFKTTDAAIQENIDDREQQKPLISEIKEITSHLWSAHFNLKRNA